MSGGFLSGLQLVGATAGPLISGMEERSALQRSAAIDRENANRTLTQGELDAWQTQREARLAQGAGLAQAAADGNPVGTGTILDLVEQAALEREMEIGNLRARARGEAANLHASADAKSGAAGMALFKGVLGGALGYAATKNDQRNMAALDAARARDRASRVPVLTGPASHGVGRSAIRGNADPAPTHWTAPFSPRVPWGFGARVGP